METVEILKSTFWKAYNIFINEVNPTGDEHVLHEIFDNSLGLKYMDDLNDIHSDVYVLAVEDKNKLLLSKIKYGF